MALAATLLTAGCSASPPDAGDAAPATEDGSTMTEAPPTELTEPAAPAEPADAGETEPAEVGESEPAGAAEDTGEIDCIAVGLAMAAWIEASFAGISTEITNSELAAEYTTAAEAHAAAAAPGADEWAVLGDVIDEYVAEWSALPADGGAIEHIEQVEERVDAYAASLGFDNDDFDDFAPVIGEACADELEVLGG